MVKFNYTRIEVDEIARNNHFIRNNVEKVMRLSQILKDFNSIPELKGQMSLKGGTAINGVVFDMPRLSVDLDFDYNHNVSKNEMIEERSIINKAILSYFQNSEYGLKLRSHFLLDSYKLHYSTTAGSTDEIKLDLNYGTRCHIFEPEIKMIKPFFSIKGEPNFAVQYLSPIELFAGKLKAFFDRNKPRDVYDLYTISQSNLKENELEILRKCAVFNSTIGNSNNPELLKKNYDSIKAIPFSDIKKYLLPLLHTNTGRHPTEYINDKVIDFISNLMVLNRSEEQYITNFYNGKFNPELLFKDKEIIKRICNHPLIQRTQEKIYEVMKQNDTQKQSGEKILVTKYPEVPSFREFREKVSILQVAEHLGYKPVKGKTTSFRPVLRDANGDTILIKNPTIPGKQLYQNLGSDEKGSVIDFVKNRISQFSQFGPFRNETDAINKTLLHFSGLSYNYDAYLHQNGLKEAKPFNIDNFPFCDASLDKLRYLTVERAMNPSTVNDFLPFVKLVTNGGYMNIGFPYSVPGKDDTIKGWELRNYGFKSFSTGGDKINSTWRASFAADKSIVNNVYVFESALDAMSFYELNKTKLELSSAVLASTGGNPGLNQLLNLKNEYPAAKFHACFDNDRAGHLDDITLSCVCDHVSCTKIKTGDFVKFSVSNVEPFTLAGQDITLKNFEKKSGKCSSVDSIKPGMGKDWNEMLQLSKKKELNPEKKPTKFKR